MPDNGVCVRGAVCGERVRYGVGIRVRCVM